MPVAVRLAIWCVPSILPALLAALIWPPIALADDWRTQTGVFRIGVVDTGAPVNTAARYEPFRIAVAEAVGLPAEVIVMRDAIGLIDAQTSGRIEYAVLSSLGYAAAQTMCACLVPLAAPRSAEGATGVRSVLVADAERVEDMDDLRRTGLTWGPPGSLTGSLVPAVAFTIGGAGMAEADVPRTRAVSFEAAASAFLAGETAAFFAWDYADADSDRTYDLGLLARLRARAPAGLAVLWRSDRVPFGPHVVRETVPVDVRAALTAMLVAMNEDRPQAHDAISPSLSGGFAAVSEEDYAFAFDIATALAEAR